MKIKMVTRARKADTPRVDVEGWPVLNAESIFISPEIIIRKLLWTPPFYSVARPQPFYTPAHGGHSKRKTARRGSPSGPAGCDHDAGAEDERWSRGVYKSRRSSSRRVSAARRRRGAVRRRQPSVARLKSAKRRNDATIEGCGSSYGACRRWRRTRTRETRAGLTAS